MIPKNEVVVQRENSAKELSWMDRMQLKLESLCEIDTAQNHTHLMQETSAYLEKQVSTVGTNVRKFCAEFVKELLLPETPDKVEATQDDTLQTDLALANGGSTGIEQQTKAVKLVDPPVFDPEGSMSRSSRDVNETIDVQQTKEESEKVAPLIEATKISAAIPDDTVVVPPVTAQPSLEQSPTEEDDAEQYAHWFVSEEYRTMRLGKSTSTSSFQHCDDLLQRSASSDSLLDWEIV